MQNIHIDEGAAETDTHRITFTLSEGSFTPGDATAVRVHAGEGRQASANARGQELRLTHNNAKGAGPLIAACRTLRARYPRARFTTYGNSTKERLGDHVDQITYRPRR